MMLARDSVTLYHFDEENESYSKRHFPKAHVFLTYGAASDKTGRKGASACRIRIYTSEKITVSPGDYVFIGNSGLSLPDKEHCFSVAELCDNRHFHFPHWRLACE